MSDIRQKFLVEQFNSRQANADQFGLGFEIVSFKDKTVPTFGIQILRTPDLLILHLGINPQVWRKLMPWVVAWRRTQEPRVGHLARWWRDRQLRRLAARLLKNKEKEESKSTTVS